MGRPGDSMNNLHAWIDLQLPLQMVQYLSLAKIYITKNVKRCVTFLMRTSTLEISLYVRLPKQRCLLLTRVSKCVEKDSFAQSNVFNYGALFASTSDII